MRSCPSHRCLQSESWLKRLVSWLCLVALLGGDQRLLAVPFNVSGDTVDNLALGTTQTLALDGNGNLIQTGEGTLRLESGTGSFSGQITVNGGVLVVTGAGQLGAATTLTVTGSQNNSLYTGGMLVVDGGTSGVTLQQDITLAGRGSLSPTGNTALLSIGNNTFSGALVMGGANNTSLTTAYGNTTLSGPVEIGVGNNTSSFLGNGNLIISGSLSSFEEVTGRLQKSQSVLVSSLWL